MYPCTLLDLFLPAPIITQVHGLLQLQNSDQSYVFYPVNH